MSSPKNNKMMNYSFRLFWYEPDNGYIALCPEFPDQSAFGETPAEAVSQLVDALELAIQIYQEEGWPLPQAIKDEGYSGQFRVRLPKQLHAALAAFAQVEGVSLNTLVVNYLSRAIGEDTVLSRAEQALTLFSKNWGKTIAQQTAEIKSMIWTYAKTRREAEIPFQRKHPIELRSNQALGDESESESKASWLKSARQSSGTIIEVIQ